MLFRATPGNVMRDLGREGMGVAGSCSMLITPSISQAEQMQADFDCVCGNVGLRLDPTKTMFMTNEFLLQRCFAAITTLEPVGLEPAPPVDRAGMLYAIKPHDRTQYPHLVGPISTHPHKP
ncbi:unnamed protein product [Heligmosomoides polygyrus]|uniref:Reverse transcriptase domain-containing protein n=1 Tax=Heligmosomoides polygyrus TaxID=6339 RepID=A0A183FKR7_HELPZ|nr:unnamed protein product [Heligmosomoides polygyrus]